MSNSSVLRLLSSVLVLGCTVEPVREEVAPSPAPKPPPEVELVEAGEVETWRVATYPIWGLPRDLVDAPLTFLNRTGMNVKRAVDDKSWSSGRVFVLGSALALMVVGVGDGWAHANSHLYEQLFYAEAFGWGYAGAGWVAGVIAVAGFEYVVVPLQVITLRTGVDGRLWKGDASRCLPGDDGSYEPAAVLEHARGTCYFPNWQLIARSRSFGLKTESDDS